VRLAKTEKNGNGGVNVTLFEESLDESFANFLLRVLPDGTERE
jgi:hypothetical protein